VQHTLAADVGALIVQQQYFTILMVMIIGGVAFIIVFLLFSWNKRLETIVNARTVELKMANDTLAESNQQLALANKQLKVHDKMQQEFINIAAHELRTPIQPILGLTQFIRSDSKDAKQCELLDVTIRNAKRLKRLTEDILDVTRIENGSLIVNLETFNLNQIISDIVEDYRNEIERFGSDVKLIHEGQNEIIQVDGDKNRLTQVISNLIDNAVKFTTQGSITIKAELEKEDDSKALVSVTDTGPGIDPEIMPRLFTKFVAKSNKGTGLGLFISKSIIEAHGGRIWALNNYSLNGNSSRGATFAFNISLSRSRKSK
jgi:signal transduction histidine kinase